MDKVLELSKKIANAGFEPSYYYDIRPDHGCVLLDKDYIEVELPRLIRKRFLPYFSADWCWKMLPWHIQNRSYFLIAGKNRIYYESSHDPRHEVEPLIGFLIKNSLHEALLELVCWCIDNKYLKVQEDNARV